MKKRGQVYTNKHHIEKYIKNSIWSVHNKLKHDWYNQATGCGSVYVYIILTWPIIGFF